MIVLDTNYCVTQKVLDISVRPYEVKCPKPCGSHSSTMYYQHKSISLASTSTWNNMKIVTLIVSHLSSVKTLCGLFWDFSTCSCLEEEKTDENRNSGAVFLDSVKKRKRHKRPLSTRKGSFQEGFLRSFCNEDFLPRVLFFFLKTTCALLQSWNWKYKILKKSGSMRK